MHALVRPGELNLVTGGYGVAHSEVSTPHKPRCRACGCGWPCPTVPDTFPGTSPTMCRSHCTSPVLRRGCCSARWPARVMLLGGEPFTEPLLIWWNFVGRSHDEIVEFREEWETGSERFGRVEGYRGDSDSQDRINWFVSHVAASSRLDGERDTSTSVTCGG